MTLSNIDTPKKSMSVSTIKEAILREEQQILQKRGSGGPANPQVTPEKARYDGYRVNKSHEKRTNRQNEILPPLPNPILMAAATYYQKLSQNRVSSSCYTYASLSSSSNPITCLLAPDCHYVTSLTLAGTRL